MRIVQNKPAHEKQPEAVVADNEEDQEEQAEVPESPPKSVISISGAPARVCILVDWQTSSCIEEVVCVVNCSNHVLLQGNQDFPQSAVKAFHEKTPAPSKELRPVTKNHAINQPKK